MIPTIKGQEATPQFLHILCLTFICTLLHTCMFNRTRCKGTCVHICCTLHFMLFYYYIFISKVENYISLRAFYAESSGLANYCLYQRECMFWMHLFPPSLLCLKDDCKKILDKVLCTSECQNSFYTFMYFKYIIYWGKCAINVHFTHHVRRN